MRKTLPNASAHSNWFSTNSDAVLENSEWKKSQLFLFRFFFLYFLIQLMPWDLRFYKMLWDIDWTKPHFKQLLDIATYFPSFYSATSFFDWGIFFLIAFPGAVLWSYLDGQRKAYRALWYGLTVILRYRLAAILFAFGFYKLYHLQMPFPSLSNLHTNYGDYSDWKIYFQTVGITPEYETIIGSIEIISGLLLLFRNTSIFGLGIALGFIGNIVAVNFFYKANEFVFSSLVLLIILFLLSPDAHRIWSLLVFQKHTQARKSDLKFQQIGVQRLRYILKACFVLFIFALASSSYAAATKDPFKIPYGKGLPRSKGFYNVRTFIYNHDTIPYSLTDSLRWQNAVFESWPTVSILTSREIKVDEGFGDTLSPRNIDRTYELAGLAGRSYYDCTFDTLQHTIRLQNKNKYYRSEWLEFQYQSLGDTTILLNGYNHRGDRLHVILDKIEKKYLLLETLRNPIKL